MDFLGQPRRMVNFKLIFLPFLLAFISLISGYTFIRWLVDIKLHLISIDEMVWDLFIPGGLAICTTLLLTRKRLQVFRIKGSAPSSLTKLLMTIALAVPMVIAQSLVSSASYDLIELPNEDDIPAYKHEKFFSLEQYRVRPSLFASDASFRVRGKHNEDLNIHLYIAVPMDQKKNIWYGIRYTKTINNHLEENEKEVLFSAFLEEVDQKFRNHDFYSQSHFELLKKSDLYDGLKMAIDNKYPFKADQELYLLYPRTESLKESNHDLIVFFGIFSLIAFAVVGAISLRAQVDDKSYQDYLHGELTDNSFTSVAVNMLSFRAGCPATSLLINVCIAVYITGVFIGVDAISANVQELVHFGAVRRDLVLSGDYWRLMTSAFVHLGVAHIIMNTFVLGYAGKAVESTTGTVSFLFLVIVTALSSSLASIYWHEHTVSVGISGVNYGLVGALLTLMMTGYLDKNKKSDMIILLSFIAVSSAISFFTPNIDHAGHVGGFIAGVILGLVMTLWLSKPIPQNTNPISEV
ncbi:rhomboid family intramembrane serine protease [Photobacterium sp. OFAV2-7]|uniref:rhomboid family intramembrane serine protease n=1 Tax=Photobacterium sp. OFAV2-7 TaxID=2917748 RepID=UPI001EF576FB|nr:rhomboid family intramembrane serine protease [Photobacterium sp. OFAV2-7]MCG7588048.1 rhomboid family intramembrane serine protease [Photobacterium sp. OFAV2-7]